MKKNSILKPDVILKEYWRRNNEFADLFNAYLYGGREVINPEGLTEIDSESSEALSIEATDISVQASRDLIKMAKRGNGVEYALFAIENQEYIHYAMPLIVAGYDIHSYNRQLKVMKDDHKKLKDLRGDELMSGIKKTDRLLPVVTLVIYYGDKPWDGPKSLNELLDLPVELKQIVADYRLNLIEIKNSELFFNNKNNKDLFTLLKYLSNNRGRAEAREFLKEYEGLNVPDNSVIQAVAAITGKKIKNSTTGEDLNMYRFWEDVMELGKQKGVEEGVLGSIKALMKSMKWTADKAMDSLEIAPKDREKYMKML